MVARYKQMFGIIPWETPDVQDRMMYLVPGLHVEQSLPLPYLEKIKSKRKGRGRGGKEKKSENVNQILHFVSAGPQKNTNLRVIPVGLKGFSSRKVVHNCGGRFPFVSSDHSEPPYIY